ncbi:hypothetical protein QQ045_006106 [Rhodiola kirilowii]
MVAGVSMRNNKLRPLITKPAADLNEAEEASSTTPKAKEARIAETLPCPQAPRKRRSDKWNYSSVVREYFAVPDLESVFVSRRAVESAN